MKNRRIAAAFAALIVSSASAAAAAGSIGGVYKGADTVSAEEREYMIFFFTDGGTEVDDIIAKCGDSIVPPAAPVKDGYVFLGWNKEIPSAMPAHDMCINAVWLKA